MFSQNGGHKLWDGVTDNRIRVLSEHLKSNFQKSHRTFSPAHIMTIVGELVPGNFHNLYTIATNHGRSKRFCYLPRRIDRFSCSRVNTSHHYSLSECNEIAFNARRTVYDWNYSVHHNITIAAGKYNKKVCTIYNG